MKAIKRIGIVKNVFMQDILTNKKELNRKGVMLIEYIDNTRNVLDLKTNKDITNDKTICPLISKEISKYKDLFKDNTLF